MSMNSEKRFGQQIKPENESSQEATQRTINTTMGTRDNAMDTQCDLRNTSENIRKDQVYQTYFTIFNLEWVIRCGYIFKKCA